MTPVLPQPDDEINLFEVLHQFLVRWRWWVAGAVAGGLFGAGAGFVLPPKYEAYGVVQVAQVATPVETVPETIVRMQSLAFREEAVERLIQKGELEAKEKDAWVKALAAKQVLKPLKDAGNYLAISVSAPSPALSQALISSLLEVLKERHQPLMHERLAQLERSIALAKENLASVEKSYATTQSSLRQPASRNDAYLELARMSEAGTLAGLRQKILDLENSKLSPTTRETAFVEPVGVSDRPVSPKKPLLFSIGVLLGGMLGTVLAFGVPAWREFHQKRGATEFDAK